MVDATAHLCAECRSGPLDSCLELVCDHKLCLPCASQDLAWTSEVDAIVHCPLCARVTEVDTAAAHDLKRFSMITAPCATAAGRGVRERRSSTSEGENAQGRLNAVQGAGVSSRASVVEHTRAPKSSVPGRDLWPRGRDSGDLCQDPPGATPLRSTVHRLRSSSAAGRNRETEVPSRDSERIGVCGQCQASEAQLSCKECDELFCTPCASTIHARGRMAKHTLVAMKRAIEPFRVRHWGGTGSDHGALRGQYCSVHPGERVQFFCLDCESACMCAECAVHGAHRGHNVLNVRTAYQKLSTKISELLGATQHTLDDSGLVMDKIEALREEVDTSVQRGRRSVQEATLQLRATLDQKEAYLLAAADQLRHSAEEVLDCRAAPVEERVSHMSEVHAQLKQLAVRSGKDEPVRTLNLYSSTKLATVALLHTMDVEGDGLGRVIDELKVQLGAALDQRVQEVQLVGGLTM